MSRPDVLRFVGGIGAGDRDWNGPWPPPPKMGAIKGHMTGIVSVFDPDEVNQALVDQLVEQGSEVTTYRLGDHSKLTDEETDSMSHVVRMAEYRPE